MTKRVDFLREIDILLGGKPTGKKGMYAVETGTMATISDIASLLGIQVKGLGGALDILTSNVGIPTSAVEPRRLEGRVIVIDAGHGGSNTNLSPLNAGYSESVFVLKTVLALKVILEREGARVILTRDKDIDVSLVERSSLSNLTKPHITVSVHTNGGGGTGVEVFQKASDRTNNGGILAEEVAKSMGLGLRKPHQKTRLEANGTEYYHMLRNINSLSYIVEAGFHDNRNDLAILMRADSHIKYAEGLRNGLIKIFA